jgi:hypothetical protein
MMYNWNGELWNGFDIFFALMVFAVWALVFFMILRIITGDDHHHRHMHH